jgi:hypothetical protein
MRHLLVLIALTACACERQAEKRAAVPTPAVADPVIATQAPSSKPPAVIPRPSDQAELDRMILAGYTPHGAHLHPPGVKECPLAQGNEAVM